MEQDLIEPIVEWLNRGYSSKENIKQLSLNYGYTEEQFEQAYAYAQRRIHGEKDASPEKDMRRARRNRRIALTGIILLIALLLTAGGYYIYNQVYLPALS